MTGLLKFRRSALLIFTASCVVRIFLIFHEGAYRQPVNPVETVLVATSLASGGGFSNPYGCITGPTAHLAPVYPFILSLVYRMFPQGSSRELAIYLLSTVIVSLAYAFLPWLAAKLRIPLLVGIAAGLLGALVPLFFWVEVTSEWEAPLSALLLILSLGTFASLLEQPTTSRAIITGIAWGVSLLTAATFLPVFLALSVFLIWREGAKTLSKVAALWLPVVLLIAPWTIRNYEVFHEFILIRGNAGLQLQMSYNPNARATFDEGSLSGSFVDHPHSTPQACAAFAQWGEVVMNQRFQQQAMNWIRTNPGRTVSLIVGHFVAFWRSPLPSRIKTLAVDLLTVVALIGLFLSLKQGMLAGKLLAIVLLIYPLIYYINFFDVRYRYPLHPLILLLACLSLNGMYSKAK